MTLNRLREFLETARLRGACWTARALCRRLVYSCRRAYFFETPIEVPAEPTGDDPLEYRLATRDDLERLTVFQPYVVRSRLRAWLERDDTWVLLALDGGQPVAFYCYSAAPPARDAVLPPIRLAPNQVWIAEVYVRPEYRGRHVSLRIREHRNRLLRASGYEETVSKVDETNYPSLKRTAARLPPSARVQRVICLCVLGFRWRWVDEDARHLLEERVARFKDRTQAGLEAAPRDPAAYVADGAIGRAGLGRPVPCRRI